MIVIVRKRADTWGDASARQCGRSHRQYPTHNVTHLLPAIIVRGGAVPHLAYLVVGTRLAKLRGHTRATARAGFRVRPLALTSVIGKFVRFGTAKLPIQNSQLQIAYSAPGRRRDWKWSGFAMQAPQNICVRILKGLPTSIRNFIARKSNALGVRLILLAASIEV